VSTSSSGKTSKSEPTQAGTTVKRFHFWILSGKGKHVGRFPIADGIEPDEYSELHYNEKGECVLIRELIEGYDTPLVRRPVFSSAGRLQYSDRDGPDAETKLRNSYEYGPDGLLKARQETERDSGKLRWRILSTYDSNGWAKEQQRFEGDGRQTQRSVYEVDDEGFFTKETKYLAGELKGHYVFRRDAQHREVGREWYDASDKLLTVCRTTYGPNDQPVELQLKNPDGSLLISVYTYDPRGKTVRIELRDGTGKTLQDHRNMPDGSRWKRSTAQPRQNMPKGVGVLGVKVLQFDRMTDEQATAVITAGYAYFQESKFIDALPMFQMAAAKYPTEPYFPYAMGLCSLRLYRYEAAILYYNQALALDPNHAPSKEGLALAKDSLPYLEPHA
jgi:tetratricopeptide (TPR) repeat protein